MDILACRLWKQKSNNGSHLPNQKSPTSIPSTKLPKPFSLLDFDPLNYSIKRIRRSFLSPSLIFVPVRAWWVAWELIFTCQNFKAEFLDCGKSMANMQYWGVFHSMLEERIMKMWKWSIGLRWWSYSSSFSFFFLFVLCMYRNIWIKLFEVKQ